MADVNSSIKDSDVKERTVIEVTDHGILNNLVSHIPNRKENQQQQEAAPVVVPKVDDVETTQPNRQQQQSVTDSLLPKKEVVNGSTLKTTPTDVEETPTDVVEEVETPTDVTETTQTVDEDTIIGQLMAKFGPVEGEFEDTTEGLELYIEKLTPKIIEEGEKQGVQKLVKELPIVGDLIQHLMAGYGINSFQKKFEVTDFTKIVLDEKDIETQEKYYRAALEAKGNAPEDIDDLVEGAKDSGKLLDKSKASLTFLDGIQNQQIEQIKLREKAQHDADVKAEKETVDQIDKILKSGNLAGIPLNTTEIKSLREFGTVTDKEGLTERDKKWNALSLEHLLLLDKIVMEDFKGLGVKVNSQTKVKSLSDLKKKNEKSNTVDLTTSTSGGNTNGFKQNTKQLFGNNTN